MKGWQGNQIKDEAIDNQNGLMHGVDTLRPQPNQANRDRGPYGRLGVPRWYQRYTARQNSLPER
jgi:hypothetical protein